MRLAAGAVASALLVGIVGCGPPRDQRLRAALDGARPRLLEVQKILTNAAAVVPRAEDVGDRGCAAGTVPIVADFRPNTTKPGNLDLCMVEDVRQPWAPTRAAYPMARSRRLASAMALVLGGQSVPDDVWASDVEKGIADALAVRYVLLFRVSRLQPPHAINVGQFTGGTIEGDFFLVDLESSKVLCVLPFVGKSDESLYYFRVQGTDAEARRKEFQKVLDDNLFQAGRRDAYRRLETLIPGSKVLSY